jgi:hypothetical protein
MELHINTSSTHEAIEVKAHHTDYDSNTFTFTLEYADTTEQLNFFCSQMFLSMICRCNGNTNPVEVIVNDCKTGIVLNLKNNSAMSKDDVTTIQWYMKNTTNAAIQYEEQLQELSMDGRYNNAFENLKHALPSAPEGYELVLIPTLQILHKQTDEQDKRSFDGPYGYIV